MIFNYFITNSVSMTHNQTSTNLTAKPNDSPDIPGNKLAITDSTNRRFSCKLHRYSVFATNLNEIYGNAKKCNNVPILRYLNPVQNILIAQFFKKYMAIFYLKTTIRYSSVRQNQTLFQYDYMFQTKRPSLGQHYKNF